MKKILRSKPFSAWLGSFMGISLVCFFNSHILNDSDLLLVVGSFGATAVLLYGEFKSNLSQPRNLLGGHIISAIVGVTCYYLFSEQLWLGSSLAVATSILLMQLTRTTHPPGGATALIAVVGGQSIHDLGFLYVIYPIASGALIMLGVALLANNYTKDKKYPIKWF